MPEYQIRLSQPQGSLVLQQAMICADDAEATVLTRRLVTSRLSALHVEIWRNGDCLYDGVPAGWPYVTKRQDAPPAAADKAPLRQPRATYELLQRRTIARPGQAARTPH